MLTIVNSIQGRRSLKDDWEDLRAELTSAKQRHERDSGEVKRGEMSEARIGSDNITDSDEERLLADPEGGTTDKTMDIELESTPPQTIQNISDDITGRMSLELKEGGSGENDSHRKDSNDSGEREIDRDMEQVERSEQINDGQSKRMLSLEERLENKFQHLERMMSTTISLHSKMQDNLKIWLKQRELDDVRAKKPRIESIITLPQDSRIMDLGHSQKRREYRTTVIKI